jgi:hypothetical protein
MFEVIYDIVSFDSFFCPKILKRFRFSPIRSSTCRSLLFTYYFLLHLLHILVQFCHPLHSHLHPLHSHLHPLFTFSTLSILFFTLSSPSPPSPFSSSLSLHLLHPLHSRLHPLFTFSTLSILFFTLSSPSPPSPFFSPPPGPLTAIINPSDILSSSITFNCKLSPSLSDLYFSGIRSK